MTAALRTPFVYRFEPAAGAGRPPLLLLHGTGGDENDLVPFGRMVAPGAALVSPRGQALENGMPRFFRRLAEGVFDEDDLRERAGDLARFVGEARERYGLAAPVAVSYSNGANIAAATMLLHPGVLRGGVLMRAMPPFRAPPAADLSGVRALLLTGAQDPLAGPTVSARLAAQLRAAGADVSEEVVPGGHGLTRIDAMLAKAWLERL